MCMHGGRTLSTYKLATCWPLARHSRRLLYEVNIPMTRLFWAGMSRIKICFFDLSQFFHQHRQPCTATPRTKVTCRTCANKWRRTSEWLVKRTGDWRVVMDGWSRDRQVLETAISGTRGSLLTCHITAKYVCHSAPPQLTCSSAPAILTYISVIQTCVKPSTRADLSSRHEPI